MIGEITRETFLQKVVEFSYCSKGRCKARISLEMINWAIRAALVVVKVLALASTITTVLAASTSTSALLINRLAKLNYRIRQVGAKRAG